MRQRYNLVLILSGLILSLGLRAVDNAHFYKAANLHRTPTACWFDDEKYYEIEDYLTKIDFNIGYGETSSCWDKNGNSTTLLNSTGAFNMLYLHQNVVIDPSIQNWANFIAANQAAIDALESDNNFGKLKFHGKFKTWDFNIDLRKNWKYGLFVQALIPFRNVHINNISHEDLSPATGIYSQQTIEWKQFKNQLNTILSNYDMKPYNASYDKWGLGDISLMIGWQEIFEKKSEEGETQLAIGVNLRGGVLMPTGRSDDVEYVFSVPTGYNGHWGLNLNAQIDVGVLSWLNISTHGSVSFFLDDTTKDRRMKTHTLQNGWMKLAKGEAEEEKGTLWHIGLDVKFDHFYDGLSGLIGYSYNKKESDTLTPKNTNLFTKSTVNEDSLLDEWYMHTLHFMLDYDFSIHWQDKKWAPRLNIFYNLPIDGKNAFKTDMMGAGVGVDIQW